MKRIGVLISFLIITAAFCLLQLCSPPENQVDLKPEKYWKEQNEKYMLSLNQRYQQNLSALQSRNDSLIMGVKELKIRLNSSKIKLRATESRLLALANNDKDTITTDELSNCDSLKAEVICYVYEMDSTHALYDSTIVQLEKVVAVKDSSLRLCKSSYSELKQISEDNLRREQRLTEELEKALKIQKRKTIQNSFLTGGFLILSGIVGSILIRGK
jgi:hypothetical protein